jgi:hypothetical protein
MKFPTMPKSRYLRGLGVVIILMAAMGCLFSRDGALVGQKSSSASSQTSALSHGGPDSGEQEVVATRRVTREVNAESRVRSLLQIAPGEVGNIRIPPSGFDSLLSEEQKKNYPDVILTPITREQAIQGLETILRHGDSLSSRVHVCNGKITWKEDGIEIDGEVLELGGDIRNLNVVMEGADTNGFAWKQSMSVGFQGYSFLLARAPDPSAGGVLLIVGEPLKDSKTDH